MALTDFTSYDDIRAALGVSPDEITDATLSLPLYELSLTSELDDVGSNLIADYMVIQDTGLSTWTSAQKKFDQFTRLFATYAVARQLTVSLPLFSPKEITDGKASMGRFSLDPYKETIKMIKEQYNTFRTKLEKAYADSQSTELTATVLRPYFVPVASNSDPVTGT
jgi:hypothetical protein